MVTNIYNFGQIFFEINLNRMKKGIVLTKYVKLHKSRFRFDKLFINIYAMLLLKNKLLLILKINQIVLEY